MFNRKECPKCGKKVNEKNQFCSSCGSSLKNNNEDFGMLGRDDRVNPVADDFSNSMFGGLGGNMLGKMLGNAMKMLEKEMQREMNRQDMGQRSQKSNFELFINGKRVNPSNIKVSHGFMQKQPVKKEVQKVDLRHFSEKQQKEFSKFKQIEPNTNVKRFSDKVVYEVDVPGVKSISDVSIVRLENSIEIKAISKDQAYFKVLSVNLPIIAYELLNKKLILELGIKD